MFFVGFLGGCGLFFWGCFFFGVCVGGGGILGFFFVVASMPSL